MRRPSASTITCCVGPAEVGDVAAERDVDVGLGSPYSVSDREDDVLEVVAGRRGGGEDSRGASAAPRWLPVTRSAGLMSSLVERLVDRSAQRLVRQDRREVDQGPGRRRDRDALAVDALDVAAAMAADALVAPQRRGGHLGVAVVPASPAPERRGGEVAEDGVRPAGLDRGEEARLRARASGSRRRRPAVDREQAAGLDALRARLVAMSPQARRSSMSQDPPTASPRAGHNRVSTLSTCG